MNEVNLDYRTISRLVKKSGVQLAHYYGFAGKANTGELRGCLTGAIGVGAMGSVDKFYQEYNKQNDYSSPGSCIIGQMLGVSPKRMRALESGFEGWPQNLHDAEDRRYAKIGARFREQAINY
jgi:hypothetical protein